MRKPFNFKSYLISALRRASYRSPIRNEVLKNARQARNSYKCNGCGHTQYTRKEVAVDHIHPIVPITGWDTWDGFISRLFCDVTELQVLCKPCHNYKTKEENKKRREYGKGGKKC